MRTLLLAIALSLGIAQTGTQPFAGTWTAAHDGTTFARLELHEANDALAGRISLGSFHVDQGGAVDQVLRPASQFTPIFDVSVRDGVLAFARKDGDDTDRFEIRIAEGGAELTFVISAEDRETAVRMGVPLPKPVRLVKAP